MSEAAPFFIIGAGRSGSTLLRLMLNRHPDICVPCEAWFLSDLMDQLPLTGKLSSAQLELAGKIILKNERWSDWRCDNQVLRQTILNAGEVSLAELIDQIYRTCSEAATKSIWGEKTPKHSFYIDSLNQLFPQARFIHLVRDGHDVAAALVKRGWYDGSIRRAALFWQRMVDAAEQARKFGPPRYLSLTFENLIREPEKQLRQVCDFLQVSFDPAMLGYQKNAAEVIAPWEGNIHEKLSQGLDTSEIGRWRRELTWLEVLITESLAGKTLRREGYAQGISPALNWLKPPCRLACLGWQKLLEIRSKLPKCS